jgi:hypothetical protein
LDNCILEVFSLIRGIYNGLLCISLFKCVQENLPILVKNGIVCNEKMSVARSYFLCKEFNKKYIEFKKEVLKMNMPIIGITLGDPCGIGPEITVKALGNEKIYRNCRPVVIGDRSILESAMSGCSINLEINTINEPSEGKFRYGSIDLIDLKNV